MGLDVWFRDDVARLLASTAETMMATQAAVPALDQERAEAYHQGFTDAIRAVAVAFGVAAPTIPGDNGNRETMRVVAGQRLLDERGRAIECYRP